jgi:quercetin dioxygenase-like cupin family protein
MDDVHATRRRPAPADAPLDLQAAAAQLLGEARALTSGRLARTLTPGAGAALKQTLLALTAGQQLQEHVAPGPTTLTGIVGHAVLRHGDSEVPLTAGGWTPCPTGPHTLEAETDTVLLITVVPAASPDQTS